MSFAAYLGAILLVPSTLFFATAAQAQDVELGPSLICDTKQQVERFIALYDGDTQTAISAVNTEAQDPTACGLVTAAYVRGPQLATARNKDTTFGIAQILILGIADDEGSVKSVTPVLFYSLFPVDRIEI